MKDKNAILNNYVVALSGIVSELANIIGNLGDNPDINDGLIKSAYVNVTALNSETVLIQNALDNYFNE